MTGNFPLTFAAILLLLVAFVLTLRAVATAGDKRAMARREFLRDATPAHHQGREAEFDEYGRPW